MLYHCVVGVYDYEIVKECFKEKEKSEKGQPL